MPFQGKAPTVVVRPSLEERVRAHLEGQTIDAVSLRGGLLTILLSNGQKFCVSIPGELELETPNGDPEADR